MSGLAADRLGAAAAAPGRGVAAGPRRSKKRWPVGLRLEAARSDPLLAPAAAALVGRICCLPTTACRPGSAQPAPPTPALLPAFPLRSDCGADENWTCITFYPDLQRFGMAELEAETVELMRKRVYDMAGILGKTVKVGGWVGAAVGWWVAGSVLERDGAESMLVRARLGAPGPSDRHTAEPRCPPPRPLNPRCPGPPSIH